MTINNKSERNYRGKCLGSPVTSYGGANGLFEPVSQPPVILSTWGLDSPPYLSANNNNKQTKQTCTKTERYHHHKIKIEFTQKKKTPKEPHKQANEQRLVQDHNVSA